MWSASGLLSSFRLPISDKLVISRASGRRFVEKEIQPQYRPLGRICRPMGRSCQVSIGMILIFTLGFNPFQTVLSAYFDTGKSTTISALLIYFIFLKNGVNALETSEGEQDRHRFYEKVIGLLSSGSKGIYMCAAEASGLMMNHVSTHSPGSLDLCISLLQRQVLLCLVLEIAHRIA